MADALPWPARFVLTMQRIKIDFLAPADNSQRQLRRLQIGLWSLSLSLATAEIIYSRHLLAERDQLTAEYAATITPPSRTTSPRATPPQTSGSDARAEQELLSGLERAVARLGQAGSDLHLDSLAFDRSRRQLIVDGDSSRTATIDRLASELQAALPQARIGFPTVRNAAERVQFEIKLQLKSVEVTP